MTELVLPTILTALIGLATGVIGYLVQKVQVLEKENKLLTRCLYTVITAVDISDNIPENDPVKVNIKEIKAILKNKIEEWEK